MIASKATNNDNLKESRVEVLLQGFPAHLECHQTATAGRTVITLERIPKGAIALQEIPYCHTIHHRYKSMTCEHCYRFSSSTKLSYPCPQNCGKYYCTEACREAATERHVDSGSCDLSQQLNAPIAKSNKRSKLMNESLSLLVNITSNALPISDLLFMVQDDSRLGQRAYKSAEAEFRQLTRSSPLGVSQQRELEQDGVYAHALSTRKKNAIGMYNEYGEEIGLYLSPVIALVNHSCLPNCQQVTADGSCRLVALRDIQVGEELSYTYVSILKGSTTAERRASIAYNWEFDCACGRCQGTSDCEAFDAAHTCCCGAICLAVDRGDDADVCICNLPSVVS